MRNHGRMAAIGAALLAAVLAFSGCGTGAKDALAVEKGKMLHVQQVLESYDSQGNPMPQYLELWMTEDGARCDTLGSDGTKLSAALDKGENHLMWDAATMEATKPQSSGVFRVDFKGMKKQYAKVTDAGSFQYAGRACRAYLLQGSRDEEWVKVYVDDATGMVLLCDAPLFRLRTAKLETLPLDEGLFQEPSGLKVKG